MYNYQEHECHVIIHTIFYYEKKNEQNPTAITSIKGQRIKQQVIMISS